MAPFQFKSLCCVATLSFRAVPRLSLLFLKHQAMMAKMTNSGLKNDTFTNQWRTSHHYIHKIHDITLTLTV